MARKIVITSGKGGTGKTTICASLGFCLAKQNYKVLLLDLDIGLNNLDIITGIEQKIVYDLVDVLNSKCRPIQAVVMHPQNAMLYILPSVHTLNVGKINPLSIQNVLDNLSPDFDFILIDCPAGIEMGFYRAVCLADEAIVVTTPHISSIRNADKVVSIINGFYQTRVGLVINKIRPDMVVSKTMLKATEIAKTLNLKLLGTIPENDKISSCQSLYGSLPKQEADIKDAFLILSQNILNGTSILFDYTQKYKGFWGRIKSTLKERI